MKSPSRTAYTLSLLVLSIVIIAGWLTLRPPSPESRTTEKTPISPRPVKSTSPAPMPPSPPRSVSPVEPSPVTPPSAEDPALTRAAQIQAWLAMMTSPAATGAAAAQARKLTLDRYEPFLAQNDFPPEQRERLLHFFDEKRQALLDVAIASYQNHLDPLDDFAAYQARVVDVRRTVDAQIRELLGGDTYAQLEDFDENMAEAATFTRLNRILAATPNAFSPDQTAQLSALLNSATHGTLSPELIDHAAKFLTAAQIEALQSAYDTQESIPRQRALDLLPER